MKRLLCPQLPKPHRPATLSEDEANHAVRVLRLKDGDSVEAIDGQGHSVPAILRTHGGAVRLELTTADLRTAEMRTEAADSVVPLILEMAVLKGDAMEWVVEKAVELGVRTLVPTLTAHTIVQMKNKGPEAFRERWQKIADQALKQCGRLERLQIENPITLENLTAQSPMTDRFPRYWCDETARGHSTPDFLTVLNTRVLSENAEAPEAIRLLIGPEGGWSEAERGLLAPSTSKVSLGPLVLRAETAAVYGASLVAAAYRASDRLTKKRG
jgi:16S rRNA (uracil1498-N3)-methyltransferase